MQTYWEVERTWRERLLDEYQHAQVIDRMDRQALVDEYQRAQAIDRMDQQNSTMSELVEGRVHGQRPAVFNRSPGRFGGTAVACRRLGRH
jgi:hypothetical protein